MTLSVGDVAPDFTLRDQHGRARSLGTHRGERAVAVLFFPYAFSSVCTGELRELRDGGGRGRVAGAELLAVSCDPMFTLRALAEQDGLDVPLLSDFWPHGEVATAFGAFDSVHGCATRSTFLLDPDGVLRWRLDNPMGEARRVADLVREVEMLGAGTASR
jgi:mycoredoxin-dependent peroxiredoxin